MLKTEKDALKLDLKKIKEMEIEKNNIFLKMEPLTKQDRKKLDKKVEKINNADLPFSNGRLRHKANWMRCHMVITDNYQTKAKIYFEYKALQQAVRYIMDLGYSEEEAGLIIRDSESIAKYIDQPLKKIKENTQLSTKRIAEVVGVFNKLATYAAASQNPTEPAGAETVDEEEENSDDGSPKAKTDPNFVLVNPNGNEAVNFEELAGIKGVVDELHNSNPVNPTLGSSSSAKTAKSSKSVERAAKAAKKTDKPQSQKKVEPKQESNIDYHARGQEPAKPFTIPPENLI